MAEADDKTATSSATSSSSSSTAAGAPESLNIYVSWLLIHQVLFTLTGVTKTIGNQQMTYMSPGLGWLILTSIVSALGPAAVPVWFRGMSLSSPSQREVITAGVASVRRRGQRGQSGVFLTRTPQILDAAGTIAMMLGMEYAGSGLTSVVYASLPAFTAGARTPLGPVCGRGSHARCSDALLLDGSFNFQGERQEAERGWSCRLTIWGVGVSCASCA